MRLFVAVDLEDSEYFKQIQDQLPQVRMTHPQAFHITLKFLGETDKQQEVIKELKKVRFSSLKLKTTHIGFFPSENFINVIWLGIEENKELMELQKHVEHALEHFNFKKDYSEFKPHLTLARVKFIPPELKPDFVKEIRKIKFEQKEFAVNEFKLIKSELTPEGPEYTDVAVFR